MTTFYFIRHGQTDANVSGIKQGTINDERTHLTATGINQVAQLHAAFALDFADALFCSPLDRTRETAAILNQDAKLPVTLDDRLLEISYGSWDGKRNADLLAAFPNVFDQTLQDVLPSYVDYATGGESFAAVRKRVANFMADRAAENPDGQIICVTHGFTVKAAALVALQPENPMTLPEPDNASVTKITLKSDGRYFVWYYNRTSSSAF